MAAGEDQPQPIVAHGFLVDRFAAGFVQQRLRPERGAKSPRESERGWGPASTENRGLRVAVVTGGLPAKAIDGAVASGGDDPTHGTRWQSRGRPPLQRRGKRILHRLLRRIDVAELADEDGHRAAVLLAENPLDHPRIDLWHVRALLH